MRLLWAALWLCGCGHLQRISELEDRRDALAVETYTTVRYDAATRRRALWALGRIQDPRTWGRIADALGDNDEGVRDEAAFAAGLMALSWQPLPDEVKARLAAALNAADPTENVLTALGRLGFYARLLERGAFLQ